MVKLAPEARDCKVSVQISAPARCVCFQNGVSDGCRGSGPGKDAVAGLGPGRAARQAQPARGSEDSASVQEGSFEAPVC